MAQYVLIVVREVLTGGKKQFPGEEPALTSVSIDAPVSAGFRHVTNAG